MQCTPSAKYTMWLANATASDTVPHSRRHNFRSKWYSEHTTEHEKCHEDSACPLARQAACESVREREAEARNILVRDLHSEMPARLVPKHTHLQKKRQSHGLRHAACEQRGHAPQVPDRHFAGLAYRHRLLEWLKRVQLCWQSIYYANQRELHNMALFLCQERLRFRGVSGYWCQIVRIVTNSWRMTHSTEAG